ncbi:CdaR family protein [uncultured Polaribacter sp.]|uniref:CdaR family protein n=1 Tax=uncultured Polaribacter sp. TaxID=174711 RepID=UPI002609FF2D|nr:CdaR family protein [uncultured Polaribacter sp.]
MKKSRKISKSFIGFLFVSMLIWVLITMSKEYVTTTEVPIAYINIPQNLLLQKQPKKTIEITVKASGFKISMLNLRKKVIDIELNTLSKKNTNTYYVLTRNYFSKIKNQLADGVTLQQIEIDTLFLSLGSLQSKKLVVVPNYKINYHIGYDLSEAIAISPDSILVSGPKNQIEQLQEIQLEPFELSNVKENFSKEIHIAKPKKLSNLRFETEIVTLKGKVEKFTEGTINVDFEIINVPKDFDITTLVKSISLTFIVSLSDFNKVNEDSFKVECDYNISLTNNLNYLVPKIVRKPSFVKSIKFVPSKIDYLIQK